jgi:hypothetical protein
MWCVAGTLRLIFPAMFRTFAGISIKQGFEFSEKSAFLLHSHEYDVRSSGVMQIPPYLTQWFKEVETG